MGKIKFLLINPSSPVWRVEGDRRPRGSRYFRFSMLPSLYVAASMPAAVKTKILDEDIEPIDFNTDADLVGISFMTYNAPRAYAIADRFRNEKRKPVVFGGYHPTLMPDEAARHADTVCVGDAENNVPQMAEDFMRGRLKPRYDNGPADLARLPIPDRKLVRKRDYAPVDALQATRGCHQRCSFCSISAFHRHRLRIRPVGRVIEELKTLGRQVLFMDDNLIGDAEYAKELFSEMIPLGKQWYSQCGVRIAEDENLLDLASRSGCRSLFVGFESLSEQNLSSWKKECNIGKDYLSAVRKFHEAGIGVCAAFVFGSDGDTPDVFGRTLEFLLESNVESVQATRITPFPGTPLFEEMERQGRIFDKDWSHYDFNHVVFEPLHMSAETLHLGAAWVLRQFFARRRIAQRVWRSLRYLHPTTVLRAVVPVNLGYRHRLTVDGTFQRGDDFVKLAKCNRQSIPL